MAPIGTNHEPIAHPGCHFGPLPRLSLTRHSQRPQQVAAVAGFTAQERV
jgi:hypothetical protein